MEFRILGPLEVLEEGRTVDVGAAKQRALLAVLLLDANRVVSRDELVAALWGERAPETAGKALQVYVSQLRRALGRERIVTRRPGYLLRVEPGELDLEGFEQLAAEGRQGEALALWRGRPLADFAYEPFAQTEIARLEELRLACLEQRIERDLDEGRHAALVAELEALVREHPLRERLRAQLMLALYRSGRQAEALDAYQAGRSLLADELGLEPGSELKELQRAILAHDPALLPEEQPRGPVASSAPAPEEPRRRPALRSREMRKTVTVLVCDVAPTDPRLDPESLRRIGARGFEELLPVLTRHGATVERSIGGAVTAIFGIPAVHEDDALRAVRAATEMRARLEGLREELEGRWGSGLELRGGIGTGEVLTGGDDVQPFATGAAVQSALDLHRTARRGELLLDERTYRLVRDAVDAEAIDGRARLLAVRTVAPGYPSRFDSPIVGRKRERRRLHDVYEQAIADRSCQLFTILGSPGVGKSRLVREFVSDVAEGALVARGRCLPYGEGITYWPVLEVVRDVAFLDDAESVDDSLAKLVDLLEGEEDAELVVRHLGHVIGLTEEPSGPEDTYWAVRTFFEAVARRRPLIVVFDDIHWGEVTFFDLVDHIADWAHDAPLLLICIARTELLDVRPDWGGGKLNATSVLLEPLSEAESEQLVDNLAVTVPLEASSRRQIVETAGGNPLFVEEMLALLNEDPLGGTAVEVPATIHAVLAARLDRLADDERAALEAASVEGKIFHEASVAELVAGAPSIVNGSLLSLVRKELIRPERSVFSGVRAYRFRHLLIRDAAYQSIPKEARAAFHERFGRWLEQTASERTTGYEEIIGYHLEQAYLYRVELGPSDGATRQLAREAAERLGSAARRAFIRGDAAAAVNLISRAIPLLPADDPLRVGLVPNIRVVQGLSGDLSWAERVLTEAVSTAAATDDRRLEAHARVQRSFLRLSQPHVTRRELLAVGEHAISVFEEFADELGLAQAWRLVAQAHYLARQAGPSAEAFARALEHARRVGDRLEVREIVQWLCVALMLGPTPAPEAVVRCRELLADVRRDPILEPTVLSVLSNLEAMQGHVEEAHELLARYRRAADALGESIWLFAINFGFVVLADDPAAAERELRPGYEALTRIGEKSHFSSVAGLLARAVGAQGRYEEAERLSRESERTARPNDIHSHILWRTARAQSLAHMGDLGAAEALAREAVAFAAKSDFLDSHGDALTIRADVLCTAHRPGEAVDDLAQAIRLYEQKGNIVSTARARARLEQLTTTG